MKKEITPEQCRMARAALKWTTKTVAEYASVGLNTVNRFEKGTIPKESILQDIRSAFEKQGVKFTDKGCVCYLAAEKEDSE